MVITGSMKLTAYIFVLLPVVSALIWTGCGTEQSTDKSNAVMSDSAMLPDAEVLGATIKLYEGGQVTTRILADKIVKYESIDSTMGYGLDIDLYDSAGVVTSHIVGDSGVIRENAGLLHIFGNVVVVTNDNRRLESDDLMWDKVSDQITTDAFVRITRGDDVVTGWGLEANNSLTQVRIKRASGEMSDTALVD